MRSWEVKYGVISRLGGPSRLITNTINGTHGDDHNLHLEFWFGLFVCQQDNENTTGLIFINVGKVAQGRTQYINYTQSGCEYHLCFGDC